MKLTTRFLVLSHLMAIILSKSISDHRSRKEYWTSQETHFPERVERYIRLS